MDRNRSGKRERMGKRKKLLLLPVLLLAVMLIAGTIGLDNVHADSPAVGSSGPREQEVDSAANSTPGPANTVDDPLVWHEKKMKPGEVFDISDAEWNTTVYIRQAGNYTLEGKSDSVRVVIESGGVNLYLSNGLQITASAHSYTGSRNSAIWVQEMSGTVNIISKKNAKVSLTGYMCPAIEKDGTTSRLVFDTEDKYSPGTITAQAGTSGAAIGSVYYHIYNIMGNIVFNGGNIKATSSTGAGIGGCAHCTASNIIINGGDIEAYGGFGSAGIGGGFTGDAEEIVINGGRVYAEVPDGPFSSGAAIGSGGEAASGANLLRINGGTVTAVNKNVNGPAIGSLSGALTNMYITGGNVTALSGARSGVGIGSKGRGVWSNMFITGGTVYAHGGYLDLAANEITITGGSILADKNGITPKNSDGQLLHRVNVKCRNLPTGDLDFALSNLISSAGYSYGLGDVLLSDYDSDKHTGMFYPWLPDTDEKLSQVTVKTSKRTVNYYGDVSFNSKEGILNPATAITLVNGSEPTRGYADGLPGRDQLINLTAPPCQKGSVIAGYYNSANALVADSDGNLSKNVANYTDGNGEWIYDGTEVTLNAQTRPCKYTVHFDGNQPRGASTKVSGNMDDLTDCEYDKPFALSGCRFTLPGYDFAGWNTRADGSGTRYEDMATVRDNLTDKDGDTVTLYAQWDPKIYSITLSPGVLHAQSVDSPIISFDEHATIPSVPSEWKDDLMDFHCWVDENGNYYDDCEDFCNLVKYNGDDPVVLGNGNLDGQTLTAQWIEHGRIAATVTVDDKPEAGHQNDFILIDQNNVNNTYEPEFTYENGIYTYVSPGSATDPGYISPGKYIFSFNPDDGKFVESRTVIDYKLDATASAIFDYYSVSIERDPAIVAIDDSIFSVVISGTGILVPGKENVRLAPDNARLTIQTNMKAGCGYHFDGYSVLGTVPGNSDGSGPFDPSKPNQAITVTGQSAIMAHAEANTYTVHFDANADSGISGEMDDQDMVYDQPQNLFSLGFERIGATFTGWNTKRDGSGDTYPDGHSVENLTTENGGTVTLYAQWKLNKYKISYDLGGGELPEGKENPTTYTAATPTFTLVDPERENYNFLGWAGTDLPEPTRTVTIEQNSAGDRYYVAVWDPICYNVKFISNGGTLVDPQRVRIHHKVQKPGDPTREGYTFAGWYADEALTTPFDFDQAITEDTTLYAKWEGNNYFIHFDPNSASGITGLMEDQVMVYDQEQALSLNEYENAGRAFLGWNTKRDGSGDVYTDGQSVENLTAEKRVTVTLYAQWSEKGTLLAKMKSKKKKALILSWNKIAGAEGYDIFFAKCTKKKDSKVPTKKVKTIKGNKTFKWTRTGLKKQTAYKAVVKAWYKKAGKKKYFRTSPLVHAYTSGGTKAYTNAKSVTVKKAKVSLKAGKTFRIKATVNKISKKKKLMPSWHVKPLRYMSSSTKIATVTKAGKIRAKAAGTCKIYVYAHNGVSRTVNVTVK